MPVGKVRAPKSSARSASQARKLTEATCDLLAQSDRVLIVYGKETASIYYEHEEKKGRKLRPLSRAS